MARERGRNREREEASDDQGDTEEVRWERGSGGVEPRGQAVPRPRAPETEGPEDQSGHEEYETARRGRERAPTAGAESGRRRRVRGEDVQTGASREGRRESGDRGSRASDRDRDSTSSERRYGATGRRQSSESRSGGGAGGRTGGGSSDRPGGESGTGDAEQSARSAGNPEGQRVGWPGNRRSRVGDTDTGSPHSGSQRGSERESGIAGRAGGHFGEDRSGDSSDSGGRNQPEQFGGERGGDERDRRYGSRRGHGAQRREDRRTE